MILLQEFSKEVDAKSSQKSSVLSTGNQLLRLKKVDTAALRAGLSQIDSQWIELLTQIPVVQEKLHQVGEKFTATTAFDVQRNIVTELKAFAFEIFKVQLGGTMDQ